MKKFKQLKESEELTEEERKTLDLSKVYIAEVIKTKSFSSERRLK